MIDLISLIHQIVKQIEPIYRTLPDASPSGLLKPVFQPSGAPIPVSPDKYQNAHGPANPGGAIPPLHRFYTLVDRVPFIGRNYIPSPRSADNLYGNLIRYATVRPEAPTSLQGLLLEARRNYELAGLYDLSGTFTQFRPAFATPDDWWNPDTEFTSATIIPDNPSPTSGFTILEGRNEIPWRLEGFGAPAAGDRASRIREIRFRYKLVQVRRPWLEPMIFSLPGWGFSGIKVGGFSTGRSRENDGLLPLIVTGFLLVQDVQVEAEWGPEDEPLVSLLQEGQVRASYGPFMLGDGAGGATEDLLRRKLSSRLSETLLRRVDETYLRTQLSDVEEVTWPHAIQPEVLDLLTGSFQETESFNLENTPPSEALDLLTGSFQETESFNLENAPPSEALDLLTGSFQETESFNPENIPPFPVRPGDPLPYPMPESWSWPPPFPKPLPSSFPDTLPLPLSNQDVVQFPGLQIIGWISYIVPFCPQHRYG